MSSMGIMNGGPVVVELVLDDVDDVVDDVDVEVDVDDEVEVEDEVEDVVDVVDVDDDVELVVDVVELVLVDVDVDVEVEVEEDVDDEVEVDVEVEVEVVVDISTSRSSADATPHPLASAAVVHDCVSAPAVAFASLVAAPQWEFPNIVVAMAFCPVPGAPGSFVACERPEIITESAYNVVMLLLAALAPPVLVDVAPIGLVCLAPVNAHPNTFTVDVDAWLTTISFAPVGGATLYHISTFL